MASADSTSSARKKISMAREPNRHGVATPSYPRRVATRLVVKCTWGADGAERCNQAFTVAATAAAAGLDVSLWLTGEAAWLAVPGRAGEIVLPHAAALPDLLEAVLRDGQVTVCAQCAARRDLTEADLADGVRVAGSAVFVAEAVQDGVQALVY